MKLKLFLSTLIFALVATISVSQLSAPVKAFAPPVTSPVTSALLHLSGVVRYLDLNIFRFVGANGAEVNAKNNSTGTVYTTTTDANGNYTLPVDPGRYMIWAYGASFSAYKFVPQFNNLPILFSFNHMDFFGLPKH